MEKNILVAGGTGLVGHNVVNKLLSAGMPFVATSYPGDGAKPEGGFLPYDFLNFEDCLSATKDRKAVVICAALSYGAKRNKEAPTAAILPNLQIAAGLLEASARNNVATVVMLSTSTVYQPVSSPVKEDELDLNEPPYSGNFGAGWTYRFLEQLAALYTRSCATKVAILRPTNIYGPFDKFDEDRAHVVPSLIRRALAREDPFEIWGRADVVRDFIFVEDIAEDILAILKGEVDPRDRPVNIANGLPMTIKEAAEIILEACGHSPGISFNPQKPSGAPYQALDTSRYLELFGKRKRTAFREGIGKTVEWYKKNRISTSKG